MKTGIQTLAKTDRHQTTPNDRPHEDMITKQNYQNRIMMLNLGFFSIHELCRYYDNAIEGRIANRYPVNEDLNRECRKLILLDQMRASFGSPIKVNSLFRSPDYNAAVNGEEGSKHLRGTAVDCYPTKAKLDDWVAHVLSLREAGMFSGGVGLYDHFVHIDFDPAGEKQQNRNWDKRTN